ncbi:baseplate J/gp47 family protein [Anaerosporobacter sp.]
MFEEQTYEIILQRMLERVKTNLGVDTSEGSLVYNILAPEAWELSQCYIAMDTVLDTTFANTAPREELILRAKERGISPYEATKAIIKGEFNIDVPIESRFTLDELAYVALEKLSIGIYKMECETAGILGNKKFGDILADEYIEGLETAKLTELLIPGTDEEETEAFRTRYFDSFESQAFGGNRADYSEKIKAITGVGGVKISRATDVNKTINTVIITSEYSKPSVTLVNLVQTAIDPTQNSGEGYGLAPIGHVVLVSSCDEVVINLACSITLEDGYTWSEVSELVTAKVEEYLLSLRKEWENNTYLIVRIAQISSQIVSVQGVEDVSDIKINNVASNYSCEANEIPVIGSVTNNADA